MTVATLFMIAALICFIASAIGRPQLGTVNLLAAGLACTTAAALIGGAVALFYR